MLLKFTYYAHYYAQEQELLSDYYAFYMQFCISSSLHVADNFIKTVLLMSILMKGIKVHTIQTHATCTHKGCKRRTHIIINTLCLMDEDLT